MPRLSTPFRQGNILTLTDFEKLKPPQINNISERTLPIIISHSCDIASDEPKVEFICGTIIDEINGHCTKAKNSRTLHLRINFEGEEIILELKADQKFCIEKQKLELEACKPDTRYFVDENNKNILQSWLSSRYKRHTLPDKLNNRLREVLTFLKKEGKKNAEDILGYWISYEPKDEELRPEDVYDFWLYIIYSIDDPAFGHDAKALALKVEKKFPELIQKCDMGLVHLVKCEAFSEEEFTLNDQRKNIEFFLDYLSYDS
jgi:hypothetical protein